MTRYAKPGKKRHLEASEFRVNPLLPRGGRQQGFKANGDSETKGARRHGAGNDEARRNRRAKERKSNTICFACRKPGHSVSECRAAKDQGVGVCYKCGSTEHTTQVYAFAKCFVCGETGHLASKCSKNERGIYPQGGCCRFCGSVQHLSKNCKPTSETQVSEFSLGKIDLEQGGDDDDVFLALHRIQETKGKKTQQKCEAGTSAQAPRQKAPKKIVSF
ncbi:hypothetical protein THASP1DRAFT_27194 [Thamnocephalis sphaerospora]|uniref:CCHC-type domain-containing protein n=1 Tax=Thamnocephalis sphaerospora TaxID=78915 RepID=A0A4P9XZ58_9FUNG|nr:hypothetical protein THASP1DRAFT_27194 [Thamnocephalis sphaerospora]|eukprot:RKP11021.1 hypothetical protein THASP1DRAFT_27194 [Thamnocephalis sphaerospora]